MEISINNFRSIVNKKYIFEKGNNLITGVSGLGKSTILEAVIWCFYGGSNVSPFNKKKIITKVEIKLNNIIFIRTKPPEKCTVILEDKKLEFDEAQEYIYNFLGSKSLWETSSYLKQDNRSNLLFHSSQEKYSLIKEIVFGRDDNENSPEKYLKKLETFKENLESQNLILDGKIQVIEEDLKHLISNFQEFDYIEKKQKTFKKILPKYGGFKEARNKVENKIFTQEEISRQKIKLKEYQEKLKEYPSLNLEIIQKWKNWYNYSRKLKNFDKSFEKIKNLKLDVLDLETEIKILIKNKEIYDTNLKSCQNLEIDYSEDSVNNRIKELQVNITNIEKYKEYNNIMNNVKKITDKIQGLNSVILQFKSKESVYVNTFQNIMKNLKIEGNFEFILRIILKRLIMN